MHPKRAKGLETALIGAMNAILEHEGILKSIRQVEDGETFFTITGDGGRKFLVQILAYDLGDETQNTEESTNDG